MRLFHASLLLIVVGGFLVGCNDRPPSDTVKKAVEEAVVDRRSDVGLDSYKLVSWRPGPQEKEFVADFTATLKLKEPVGIVVCEIYGKNIVHVVANSGETLAFTGKINAEKMNDGWHVSANADRGEDKDPWTALEKKLGPVTYGYPVYGDPSRSAEMRKTLGFSSGANLLPLSKMQPCVLEGSEEVRSLQARLKEAADKAQALALEQQKQRDAALAEQRRQMEADRQARIAEQNARQQAAHLARLLPFLQPFKSKAGVAVVTGADLSMSALLTDVQVDETALTVKGKGIDLRQMPFKEFTFDGVVADNGLTFTSPLSTNPLKFMSVGAKSIVGPAGSSVTLLSDDDRAHLDKLVAQAAQLVTANPATMQVEVLDAAAIKARQPGMQFGPLLGAIFFRGRSSPNTATLFAGDPLSRRAYTWQKESVDLRLTESVRGRGIFILCGSTPIDHLTVTINGVHHASVDAIARNGAAIITLPPDLDVLDLRFAVEGAASARAIALMK